MAAKQHTTAQHGCVWVDITDACCQYRHHNLKTRKLGYCVINVHAHKEPAEMLVLVKLFQCSFAIIILTSAKDVTFLLLFVC